MGMNSNKLREPWVWRHCPQNRQNAAKNTTKPKTRIITRINAKNASMTPLRKPEFFTTRRQPQPKNNACQRLYRLYRYIGDTDSDLLQVGLRAKSHTQSTQIHTQSTSIAYSKHKKHTQKTHPIYSKDTDDVPSSHGFYPKDTGSR
jgi:hypothetical protein